MKASVGRPREFDPETFLNTALECFWQKGYRATSMSDLMKASGLASASIYKLYPDKRSIYLAALQQYMDEGVSRAAERDAEFSPEMALRETLEFVALLSSSPDGEKGCFTIAAASELLPGDAEVKSKVHHKFNSIINQLEKILCRGQTQQLFRCDESPRTMAISIFMMLEGMRVYGKIQPEIDELKKSNEFIVRSVLSNRHEDEKGLSSQAST
ncbi:TetR/AcrR family transcriptional regulator [Erwinia sp. S63]|uniref:TetR/AcrR family transcriptional regulator n=1 Tax=Erwiniaceae TaxID=1903409 RepID=UPI001909A4E7|nr:MULTISPECIES: TetR/AcrR family transcriptional regulator [Erwiniaceae]MBK0003928.1 TetR/AcrR family transcriptional regulator [Erwinia sp. S38]MBK0099368.1 TetR/AcrR family transcriptional regulator [Erwinia sp. S63]MBK0127543.1 TetR/AcrR family transcriptional regulator [Pantoea sp. S61]MBK5016640.1 TetR/AcrR family transcriptional regulator [Pantoea sp. S62]